MHDGAASGDEYFAGVIDDVALWNHSLDETELSILSRTQAPTSVGIVDYSTHTHTNIDYDITCLQCFTLC